MIFKPELARRVDSGNKTVTRRPVSAKARSPYHPSRIGLMIGRQLAIQPGRGKPAICHRRVESVGRSLLHPGMLSDDEIAREGFVSRSEWLGAWADLHGSLDPVEVWVIRFGGEA